MPKESCHIAGLRNRLRDKIMGGLDEVYINGSQEHRLPGNLNISFAYVEGESLLMGINDIAVSSGSACTSATLEPSYVLKALGAGDDLAHSSIRFGLGRFNTEAEVDYVATKVVQVVKKLRELSPLYEMRPAARGSRDATIASNAVAPRARKRLYDRVQQIVAEELPIICLASPDILVGARAGLGNFRPAILDHYVLSNAEELYWREREGGGPR